MSFYIAIILFITSVIAGLILMIAGKNVSRQKFLSGVSIHIILLAGFIASVLLKREETQNTFSPNYFFLVFICSGVILSGVSWRADIPRPLRYYFTAFMLTVAMFLFSPSRLVNFVLTTRYTDSFGPKFRVDETLMLETQHTRKTDDDFPHYKLVRKRGMFTRTIQRDITFGSKLDSIRVLEFEPNQHIIIRGYTSVSTFVTDERDSADVEISLTRNKPGTIEYRL